MRYGFIHLVTGCIVVAWAWPQTTWAQIKRNVEEIPGIENLYRVSADQTPSGFPVPRYVSLKVGQVNGRTGPSLKYPIAWQYRRRGLPLIIVAETELWRKVRDIHGDETWVHKPALSGERMVIATRQTRLYRKPNIKTRVDAVVYPDALLKLEVCNASGWCKFKAKNGRKGWALRDGFWGATPL